jgi:hypothetical protein
MDTNDLISCLDYTDSPFYLSESRLDDFLGYSHIFRLARRECGLHGVYALWGNDGKQPLGNNIIPMVYICEATSEKEATKFHKLVWNQNIVPFLIVSTPKCFRLYPGFRFNTLIGLKEDQKIFEVSKTANDVFSKLSDFKAESINNGTTWANWEHHVNPAERVDQVLLKNLNELGSWLRTQDLANNTAHALIGKYLYLHYLKDRKILSNRKLEQWDIKPKSVFGRNATLSGFYSVNDKLEGWLNGTIFPIAKRGKSAPGSEHIEKVASTFSGDDPASGQMHLDFRAYNFEHIPIETLSMVYQQFMHAEGKGRSRGAYYTPVHLVNFMLDELDNKQPLTKGMKVFDPASGSGAFLVQCYRRLIERELKQSTDGKNLNPSELRKLLTSHIFGIDIDEDACNITELSLILTLLDYIDPPDLEKACYKNFKLPVLRNKNIFYCKEGFFNPDLAWHKEGAKNRYNWIVGNPPWKTIKKNKLGKGDKSALEWMNKNSQKYPTSSNQIAEAFSWKAAQHLSNNGIIGLLMPAFTLFKSSKKAKKFRHLFFSKMDVWCAVNFSNLRHLLFKNADNPALALFYSRPNENIEIKSSQIITYAPFAVNQLSRYDADCRKRKKIWAVIVNADEIREIPRDQVATGSSQPWKMAMWGTPRDGFLLYSLTKQFVSLSAFAKNHNLSIHEGLQLRTKDADEIVEHIPEVEGKKELIMGVLRGRGKIFTFPVEALQAVDSSRTYVRKGRGKVPLKICRQPHIIIDAMRRFAVFSNEFIVVPPRQIGIAGDVSKTNLLKALALYLCSDFVLYQQYMSSPSWGIERCVLSKKDLLSLPIPLDNLSPKRLEQWANLYDEIITASVKLMKKNAGFLFENPEGVSDLRPLVDRINVEVYKLLGIDKSERYLIDDFLNIRMDLNEGKIAYNAVKAATPSEIKSYANILKRELDDFLDNEIRDQHCISAFYSDSLVILKIEHPENPPAGSVQVIKLEDKTVGKVFSELEQNLFRQQGQWIYFNRNLKIFNGRTTYFVKPRHCLCWLKSQALTDADEFIAEKLTMTGA